MVLSGQIKNIVENHSNRSTNCMQAALANLLFEIIMLSLLAWVSSNFIYDVLASVCVYCCFYHFHCSYCMSVCHVLRVRFL